MEQLKQELLNMPVDEVRIVNLKELQMILAENKVLPINFYHWLQENGINAVPYPGDDSKIYFIRKTAVES